MSDINEAKRGASQKGKKVPSGSTPWAAGDNKKGASGGSPLPKANTSTKGIVKNKPSQPGTDVSKVGYTTLKSKRKK
jgi:hypothetical protein